MSLLTIDNAKTTKGEALGYLTGILYLAPANLADGKRTVCSHASDGCTFSCLFSSGRGAMDSVRDARINKTLRFWNDPKAFVEELATDIAALVRQADRESLTPCVRLNGTSDLPWENLGGQARVSLMSRFPSVQFYDYTKNPSRVRAWLAGKLPSNYNLTFSRSEDNGETALQLINEGANVACVFATKKGETLPARYVGKRVLDGDLHDLRFLDKRGFVVGLRAKGEAKKDTSGFVVHV